MVEDYADRQGWRGEPLFSPPHFAEAVIEADRRGLQICVHAIGDGAVRAVLDGYEAAAKANGRRDSRHRIEHIEVTTENDLPRFAALGVIASMQPPHPPGAMDFPLEPHDFAHRPQALAAVLCLACTQGHRCPYLLRLGLAGFAHRPDCGHAGGDPTQTLGRRHA